MEVWNQDKCGCILENVCGLAEMLMGDTSESPKIIRGGIPLSFLQFSKLGPSGSEWFAKNRSWVIDNDPPPFPTASSTSSPRAFVDLKFQLPSSEHARKIMPCWFEFCLRISLSPGGDLSLTSRVWNRNQNGKSFSFTFSYDIYFSVSDSSEVVVEGLAHLKYLDNRKNGQLSSNQGTESVFRSELDCMYLGTPTKVTICDHESERSFVVCKEQLPDTAVWNPRDKIANDFGKEEYNHMIRFGAAASTPIKLYPAKMWTGKVNVSVIRGKPKAVDPRKAFQVPGAGWS